MEKQKNEIRSDAKASGSVRRRSRQEPSEAEIHAIATERPAAPQQLDKQVESQSKKNWPKILISTLIFSVALLFISRNSRWDLSVPDLANLSRLEAQSAKLNLSLSPQKHIGRPEKLIELHWKITSAFRRPDGVLKRVFLVNDEFPGPTIEAKSGDTLRILVWNNLENEEEEVSIHFHGLHMRNANDMDGAVGFTQCPIRVNESFLYEFKISKGQHGTFWYHAHDQVQRADGLYGGLIIHPSDTLEEPPLVKRHQDYDEEQLLLIGDWYHRSADSVLDWYMRAGSFGNEPVPDSIVVNGQGYFNCLDAIPTRPIDCAANHSRKPPSLDIDPRKKYRFRIVNTGTLAGFSLNMPGTLMIPVEVDGGHAVASNGSTTSVGILYPGERVDIIVEWKSSQAVQNSWMNVTLDEESFKYPNPSLTEEQFFPLHFLGASVEPAKSDEPDITKPYNLQSATAAHAHNLHHLAVEPDITFVLYTTTLKLARLANVPHGFMNQTSWKPQSDPSQPLLALPRAQWDENQFVPRIDTSVDQAPWVDIVVNNLDDGSHPFHLHGYDFYVLSIYPGGDTYWGSYNPFDASEGPPGGPYNLVNPIQKDTVFVPRRGYTVIRFRANNPGIWMFHCHILWHQASGMSMGFQVGFHNDDNEAPLYHYNVSNLQQLQKTCTK